MGRKIEVINVDETIKYRKDFMTIKFESDDDLPLGKAFNISDVIIVAVSILEKNGKYYPQTFYMNARTSHTNTAVPKN